MMNRKSRIVCALMLFSLTAASHAAIRHQPFYWAGPLAMSLEHSSRFGTILNSQYTNMVDTINALSFELDFGGKEFRLGGTWGHQLTDRQQFKFSLEHVGQRISHDFPLKNESEWTGQNAFGLDYRILMQPHWFHSLHATASYARAANKTLDNGNRIAGATTKSIAAGVAFVPWHNNLLGIDLTYDDVDYKTRFIRDEENRGLGATAFFTQRLGHRVLLHLHANVRKPYDEYQARISWLLRSTTKSRIELSLQGSHIAGHLKLPNDTRAAFRVDWSWGGGNTPIPETYDDPSNTASKLSPWTAQPAVHMTEVLAIADV